MALAYREKMLEPFDIEPIFPLWLLDTRALAGEMIDRGLGAILTCVDPNQCPAEFAGRTYDRRLIDELPSSVDPCGENGEFHTFVYKGPMFSHGIKVRAGEIIERDGFVFADVAPVK